MSRIAPLVGNLIGSETADELLIESERASRQWDKTLEQEIS